MTKQTRGAEKKKAQMVAKEFQGIGERETKKTPPNFIALRWKNSES